MNKHHQPCNFVWELCKITNRGKSQRLLLSGQSSPFLLKWLWMKIPMTTSLKLWSQHILLWLINLIIPDLSLHLRSRTYRIIEHKDDEGTDQVWTAPPKRNQSPQPLGLHPRSVPLINCSCLVHKQQGRHYSLTLIKSSPTNLRKIMSSISKPPSAWFSDPNVFPNSLIPNRIISFQEMQSILTSSSLGCTP